MAARRICWQAGWPLCLVRSPWLSEAALGNLPGTMLSNRTMSRVATVTKPSTFPRASTLLAHRLLMLLRQETTPAALSKVDALPCEGSA